MADKKPEQPQLPKGVKLDTKHQVKGDTKKKVGKRKFNFSTEIRRLELEKEPVRRQFRVRTQRVKPNVTVKQTKKVK